MLSSDITVEQGDTESAWMDLTEEYKASNAEKESWSMSLSQLIWPADYDQASVIIEFAEDTGGTKGGPLYDTDGTTVLSQITMPATGVRSALNVARFCSVRAVRIVVPVAASDDFAFNLEMRKAG